MKKTNTLAKQAMIAAMYTVVGMVLAPITFGSVQARVSEALTLLPVFGARNILGVTFGCFLTNLIGFFTGANILGALDIIFGTLATLIAAVLTYFLKDIRIKGLAIPAAIPPILVNAVIIGLELCYFIMGRFNLWVFLGQALSVGIGQIISCGLLGVFLVRIIEKNPKLKEIFKK